MNKDKKNIYLIRHGEAQHNINYHKYGSKTFYDIKYCDTVLTDLGHKQSKELNNTWDKIDEIELVIVSPLYRTLQTATNIFINKDIPIISLVDLTEHPNTAHTCNKRSSLSKLAKKFSNIDFTDIKDEEDYNWIHKEKEETIESLDDRINKIKEYIKNRKENNICIVGHNSFFSQMLYNKISLLDNGDKEIKHCSPYLLNI